jgi:lysophospholipase L1-like esterase
MRRTRDLVINSGISGNITDNILNDFDWRVGQFKPTVVSVMIGTNDCVRDSISLDYYENKLEILLNKIRGLNAIPILHTPTIVAINEAPHCKRLPEFVEVVRRVAEKGQVILVDNWYHWQEAFKKEPELNPYKSWLDDPVHPNNKGHIEVARLLFKSLGIFDPVAFTCGGK